MSSLLTNIPALGALQTLRTIDANLEETQTRISSGLRVKDASDNAAYWSIGTTMKSDGSTLGVVRDALGLGQAKVDTAYNGLTQVKDLLSKIKDKLVSAHDAGTDRTKVNNEITELKNQITTITLSSSFSGENWLNNTDAAAMGVKHMVGSFTRDSAGDVSLENISFDAAVSVLLDRQTPGQGILSNNYAYNNVGYYLILPPGATAHNGTIISVAAGTTTTAIEDMIKAVNDMFNEVVNVAGVLGAIKSRIEGQSEFVKVLAETIDKGVSKLVDAEMNEESTRLKALQTQQQLGIQSLSIANANAQNIMQLFRQ